MKLTSILLLSWIKFFLFYSAASLSGQCIERIQGTVFQNVMYEEKYFPAWEEVEIIPNHGPLYRSVPLGENCEEYKTVKTLMRMEDIRILGISRIENEFLKRSYELKKEQRRKNGWTNFEVKLFHGTIEKSAENICKVNFDWRMHGRRCNNRCYYGKGVYFSQDANISRKYPRGSEGKRYMLLSKVLIGKYCFGDRFVVIPPADKDTTVSRNKREIVKYVDNEFCPTHRIIFIIENRNCDIEFDGVESIVGTQPKHIRMIASISQNSPKLEQTFNINITRVHSASSKNLSFNYPPEMEDDHYSDYSETSSDDSEIEVEEQSRSRTTDIIYEFSESWFESAIAGIFHILKSIWYKLVPQDLIQSSEGSESDISASDESLN